MVEEERTRIKVLRQEEEVKKQVMTEKLKSLTEQIESLAATIGDIEMTLKKKDLPFLLVCFHAVSLLDSMLAHTSYSSVGFG